MLKKRLIPTLLLKEGRCVKTVKFDSFRDTGNPVFAARVYNSQSADELIFLDITASEENRDILFKIISEVTEECFMPLTVGGGIKSVEDIRKLLKIGADKTAINSGAVNNPQLITDGAKKFGSQCIVVGIDVKKVNGNHKVFINGGTTETKLDPIEWAKKVEELGAGEILIQSIDRDGTMDGYDLKLIKDVCDAVNVPVIALGGAGKLKDFLECIEISSAVSAASIFHFTDQSPIKAKVFMRDRKVNMRKI
jgi:cyclase